MSSGPGRPSSKNTQSDLASIEALAKPTHIPPPEHPLAPTPAVRATMEAEAKGAVSVKQYETPEGATYNQVTVRLDVPKVVVPAKRPAELRILDLVEAGDLPVAVPHRIPGQDDQEDDLAQYQAWVQIKRGDAEPTPGQARIMLAVERGLAEGISCTKDMLAFALKELGEGFFTPEALVKDLGRVEGGLVGMEIFHAQGAYEKRLARAHNRIGVEKVEAGMVFKGDCLKDVWLQGHKFASLTVKEVDRERGLVTMDATKRGTRNTWTVRMEGRHPLFQSLASKEV